MLLQGRVRSRGAKQLQNETTRRRCLSGLTYEFPFLRGHHRSHKNHLDTPYNVSSWSPILFTAPCEFPHSFPIVTLDVRPTSHPKKTSHVSWNFVEVFDTLDLWKDLNVDPSEDDVKNSEPPGPAWLLRAADISEIPFLVSKHY
ncbi:hypothetical protein CEXT_505811 [Caerostris extrusa]|uniref:Uncharacterized protein n=1 Tax=Caerostris extrusa TaxID=172846 RepID=A0AAV4MG35_CAEEX|nr:hypothetical protein CEXT_505811 [Caerostris extrusa]